MKLFTALLLSIHLIQATNANDLLPQIVGGVEVDPIDRYPYQVALMTSPDGGQYCGGSLIAPMWVLTAAHCSGGGYTVTHVQIGRWNLLDNTEVYENIEVDYELPHPDFNSWDNDFMLIKLKTASQYEPVSIDDGNEDTSIGVDVTVMGWGSTYWAGPSSSIMMEVEVDIVGDSECNDSHGYWRDSMMCAYRQDKDACTGDSGGPLIIRGNSNAEDVVVGIVSLLFKCASPGGYPSVYARVSEGYGWIASHVDFAPTASPTSGAPTVDCVDSPLNAAAGGGNLGCDFVAANLEYCALGGNSHCPLTCGTCDTYICEDSEIEITHEGENYECTFLASASQNIKDIGCAIDRVVKTCRSTCGYCDE